MSRSAFDATRFTATGPHAYSKAPNSSPSGQPEPPSSSERKETPKEKVERLRAEARAARFRNSSSPVDKFISKGRTWADFAHRFTVMTLITASGVAGVLTIYSFTSLALHNRRQRVLWIDKKMQELADAKMAYVEGTVTPEQLELLAREKSGEEERLRKEELKKQGYIYRTREWLFGGLKQDEAAATQQPSTSDDITSAAAAAQKPGVLEAVDMKRAENATVPEGNAAPPKAPSEEAGGSGKQAGSGSKWKWWG